VKPRGSRFHDFRPGCTTLPWCHTRNSQADKAWKCNNMRRSEVESAGGFFTDNRIFRPTVLAADDLYTALAPGSGQLSLVLACLKYTNKFYQCIEGTEKLNPFPFPHTLYSSSYPARVRVPQPSYKKFLRYCPFDLTEF
jgi:hypothetical protein